MKGALLLSKTAETFSILTNHFRSSGFEILEGKTSFHLYLGQPFHLDVYATSPQSHAFLVQDIPQREKALGYRFVNMVECRDEVMFCEAMKSIPPKIDVLICDTDAAIFRPWELDPATISL